MDCRWQTFINAMPAWWNYKRMVGYMTESEKIKEVDNAGRELPLAKNECECGKCSCGS